MARSVAIDINTMEYIEVARLRGEGIWWLASREALPNAILPLMAEFGVRFSAILLFISTLSFLGLGIQPPAADWGNMVRENAGPLAAFGVITSLWPAAAIMFLAIGINFFIDGVYKQFRGVSTYL